jgi:uncharacterized protein YbjT (DUF2867 family)
LPKDGGPGQGGPHGEGEDEDAAVPRDSVLVVDAESPMGEQVVLQLILRRAKIRALVRNAAAARQGFGSYLEAVQGSIDDPAVLKKALRGAKAVVCCGRLGSALLPAAAAAGVPHVVLLSVATPARRGFLGIGGSDEGAACDPSREEQVRGSGIPYTIVQAGSLTSNAGAGRGAVVTSGQLPSGSVGREGVASIVALAALRNPSTGGGAAVVVQVSSSNTGQEPEDWEEVARGLQGA